MRANCVDAKIGESALRAVPLSSRPVRVRTRNLGAKWVDADVVGVFARLLAREPTPIRWFALIHGRAESPDGLEGDRGNVREGRPQEAQADRAPLPLAPSPVPLLGRWHGVLEVGAEPYPLHDSPQVGLATGSGCLGVHFLLRGGGGGSGGALGGESNPLACLFSRSWRGSCCGWGRCVLQPRRTETKVARGWGRSEVGSPRRQIASPRRHDGVRRHVLVGFRGRRALDCGASVVRPQETCWVASSPSGTSKQSMMIQSRFRKVNFARVDFVRYECHQQLSASHERTALDHRRSGRNRRGKRRPSALARRAK